MTTIKDVARLANVSVGSVSHYLNQTATVSNETRRRIEQAIEQLDYSVDLGARGLRSQRTQTIGLIIPNIVNPFFAEIARSIEAAFDEAGFQTFLCDSHEDGEREVRHVANLIQRRVDAIVAIYAEEASVPGLVEALGPTKTVFVDRGVTGRPTVRSDNYAGGRLAAEHIVALGHRSIGMMVGSPGIRNVQERVRGFCDALEDYGIELDPSNVLHGAQSLDFGLQAENMLLRSDRPTAVFSTNDIIAHGVWRQATYLGLNVPNDLSLIGFDDIEIAQVNAVGLTTVAQDQAGMGHEAAKLLLHQLGGLNDVPSDVESVLAPRLRVRGSTSVCPEDETGEVGGEVVAGTAQTRHR
jgi:LacI family transcriptional regulator